jgi:hypothetical protein
VTEPRRGITQRHDLGMGSRVARHLATVVPTADDRVAAVDRRRDDRADRDIACGAGHPRFREGQLHQIEIGDSVDVHSGSERGRTSNPRFRRPVLYPLSYGSKLKS